MVSIKIFRLLALMLIMMGVSCATDQPMRRQIDERVAALMDREITCAGAPEDTCSIPSEFHDLADRAFDHSSIDEPRHYVSILNIGQDALLARLHLIRAARKNIDLQTYIWENDETGRLVYYELLQAARRGVKVRIIVDQITITEDPDVLARLATAHANLEISFYNPTFSRGKSTPLTITTGALFSFRKTNQRMHNKLFIVDGRIGIVGGRNIENKYYDYNPTYNFKDRDIIIAGPAVLKMHESFERYWNAEVVVKAVYLVDVGEEIIESGERDGPTLLDGPDYSFFRDIHGRANHYSILEDRPSARPVAVGRVEFIADLPGKPSKDKVRAHEDSTITLREVVGKTEKSITIQTPYLVLSRHAFGMLKKMRNRNQGLVLNVSSNSLAATDLYMIYAITFKQKTRLIKSFGGFTAPLM